MHAFHNAAIHEAIFKKLYQELETQLTQMTLIWRKGESNAKVKYTFHMSPTYVTTSVYRNFSAHCKSI